MINEFRASLSRAFSHPISGAVARLSAHKSTMISLLGCAILNLPACSSKDLGSQVQSDSSAIELNLEALVANLQFSSLSTAKQQASYAKIQSTLDQPALAFFQSVAAKTDAQALSVQGHVLKNPKQAFSQLLQKNNGGFADNLKLGSLLPVAAPPFAAISVQDLTAHLIDSIDSINDQLSGFSLMLKCSERDQMAVNMQDPNYNKVKPEDVNGNKVVAALLNTAIDYQDGSGAVKDWGNAVGGGILVSEPCTPDAPAPAPAPATCDSRHPDCSLVTSGAITRPTSTTQP